MTLLSLLSVTGLLFCIIREFTVHTVNLQQRRRTPIVKQFLVTSLRQLSM